METIEQLNRRQFRLGCKTQWRSQQFWGIQKVGQFYHPANVIVPWYDLSAIGLKNRLIRKN